MCLCSKQILPRRATKDIVCYKMMRKIIQPNGISYASPFTNFVVSTTKFGEVCDAKGDYKKYCYAYIAGLNPVYNRRHLLTQVGEGYFHAYKKHQYAKSVCTSRQSIIKCIIPKGALYWNGTLRDICATKMIFVEEVC